MVETDDKINSAKADWEAESRNCNWERDCVHRADMLVLVVQKIDIFRTYEKIFQREEGKAAIESAVNE